MTKAIGSAGKEKSAARQLAETFSAETLDSLIKDAVKSGTPIDGADGCQRVHLGRPMRRHRALDRHYREEVRYDDVSAQSISCAQESQECGEMRNEGCTKGDQGCEPMPSIEMIGGGDLNQLFATRELVGK